MNNPQSGLSRREFLWGTSAFALGAIDAAAASAVRVRVVARNCYGRGGGELIGEWQDLA